MEDLKFKFLGFINKQNPAKIPSMGLNLELLNPVECPKDEVQSEADKSTESEAIPDQEILESIESVYCKADGNFDPCRHELERLPIVLNSKDIEKRYKKLKQQQQVVSKKVLQLILQKQSDCKREFEGIVRIQQQLRDVLGICRKGRGNLNLAKRQFTTASLGILANYRKRQVVEELTNNLNTIKTLQRTGDRLQELLQEGNYPGAISLLLECQSAAQTYKHFNCIVALNGKLQDTLEQVEETLDGCLLKTCTQFDPVTYPAIQEAYRLLGKTQPAMDQLHMHFTAAIHNAAFGVVHSFAGGDAKRQYKQLCQAVPRQQFILCLTELCKSLWTILASYHCVYSYHKGENGPGGGRKETPETSFDEQYVKQKLENSMLRIWSDVEMKISTFLMATDLTYIKFEQFVQILGIINRLMAIGEEMCNFRSENLQESIRRQSLSYFTHYHTLRLDELRIFLENDGWELCPVKATFVATQLQEFKSLKPALNSYNEGNSSSSSSKPPSCLDQEVHSGTGSECEGVGWLQKYLDGVGSPFDVGFDENIDEDILESGNPMDEPSGGYSSDSEDDIPEELKRDFVDESDPGKSTRKRNRIRHFGPMVTNTTLSILRICGKYLQMSRLLRSIAVTVIHSMVQFFELCFFTVHLFFTCDLQYNGDSLYSPKLKLTLVRIRETLIIDESDLEHEKQKYKIRQPLLSSILKLQSDKSDGLAERIVAVESLIFLGAQYENLRAYLEYLIGSSPQRNFLHQFYGQTISSAIDLRKPIYMSAVSKAFDVLVTLNLMLKVNWEVTDVMSQHSNYVDVLIGEVEKLDARLKEIGNRMTLSEDVLNSIWENAAHLITHTLVEGFSSAKKCSNGGRALMQLDFTQLKSKFEKITSLRPMPHKDYVEVYIKAYYLPESTLEEWIKEHKEYSSKHLVGLISCACQNNKKSRHRLVSLIEEQR